MFIALVVLALLAIICALLYALAAAATVVFGDVIVFILIICGLVWLIRKSTKK